MPELSSLSARLRPFRAWIVTGLVVVAVVGHVVFWYLPRPRPGLPGDDLPARLLEHAELPLAVWVPYPHQNLGALKGFGLDPEALSAALVLAELPGPSLPRFGPLTVPPSSSLGVATDREGERFVIAARVYPGVAAFARLAGLLAGNPWLSGGEVRRDDRLLWIRWHGSVWTVGSERDVADLGTIRRGGTKDPGSNAFPGRGAVLVAEAREARPPLPTGRYYLYADRRGLELVSDGAVRSPPSRAGDMARTDTLLLAVAGSDGPLGAGGQALALVGQDAGEIAELPRGAVLFRPGVERWDLPAEGLLSLSGRDPLVGQAAGLELVATDVVGLRSAEALAPGVAGFLGSGGGSAGLFGAGPADVPAFGLWLELGPASAEVNRLRRGLERAPLWSREQLVRWRAADRFLAGLARSWRRLELDVRESPPALWFRVESAGPPATEGVRSSEPDTENR